MSLSFFFLLLSASLSASFPPRKLQLQVLLPLNNSVVRNYDALPAVTMALEDINANPYFLQDYELVAAINDTECDSSVGSWRLIESVLTTSPPNVTKIISFIGGGCSLATEPMAALTGQLYNIVQLSYFATSPALSDRRQYPLFFRVSPSENLHNEARIALSNMYNWCKVATLYQTENIFSLAVIDFYDRFPILLNGTKCRDSNDTVQLFSFPGDPLIPLRQIKESDYRIIHGFFYSNKAVIVICYAIHLGLTTDKHLWILPGFYGDGWWLKADSMDWTGLNFRCSSIDIVNALNNSILLHFNPWLLDNATVSMPGYTNATFFERYRDIFYSSSLNITYHDQFLSPTLMYDAIWTLALALNETDKELKDRGLSLSDFRYSLYDEDDTVDSSSQDTSTNITNILFSKLKDTNYMGTSGRIKFDKNGTRISVNTVLQYRIVEGSLVQVLLGTYDYHEDGLRINYSYNNPEWNLGYPPPDRSMPISRLLNQAAIYSMDAILAIGIIIAVLLLVFQIVTIRKPLMANSAPYINIILIIGCIVMMGSSILLGIDSGTPQVTDGNRDNILDEINDSAKNRYAIICMTRTWLLTIGFTLSFGSLFAKTWQVYRVYLDERKKNKPLKMWNFLLIMVIQLIVDVIFLSIWTGLFRFRHGIDTVKDNNNINYSKFEKCECNGFIYLIGTLCAYKGLLLVFGLFLAYESRNVKYTFINDSRFVSIAMYIVVVLIAISAPLSLVLANQHFIDHAYVVAVLMITIASLSCLLVLYVPKFFYLAKGLDAMVSNNKAEVFTPVDNLKLGYQEETDTTTCNTPNSDNQTTNVTSFSTSPGTTQPNTPADIMTTGDSCGSSVPSSSEKEDFEFRQDERP
ncbi:PREDICTED: gamma-aminobutyric acid type B receptor subunit 1-like [Amphimedon queenslandica]|uniref:G-protein coupled receptors family 3 profile domain-containing protein n=1 Tax=Amphimedon queenslandica TaxID=400682 RepID=A0A1X7U6B7_AMPQE|nr:PREDICTED: gamma-aminobutyric acid type B receptor subunit 1-like [Amphimedon queenslandica]|eukprot:XP_019856011.1 PREDICTED: gamma-aminobutyric acid type B receptor subunit 1-like [Amphimedon queenslandica]